MRDVAPSLEIETFLVVAIERGTRDVAISGDALELDPDDGPMKDLSHGFMAIKRHGQPEEVAAMVAWLAGPEAGFVTGAMHTTDGAFGA
ncbi:hypothetical protein CDEF62S_05796 [Castellaniella defragrans]